MSTSISRWKSRSQIIALCALILVSCESKRVVDPKWKSTMGQLSGLLAESAYLLNANSSWTDDEKKQVQRLVQQMSELSHSVNMSDRSPSDDPALQFISKNFKEEMQKTTQFVNTNNWQKVRGQLKVTSRYCVACHTLQPGSDFGEMFNTQIQKLPKAQRGDFYAALRRFDSAINEYESALIESHFAKATPKQWNETFEKLLSITVRVKDDPSLTLELISRFFDVESYPQELKGAAHTWRKQTENWRDEKETGESRLLKARKLIEQARILQKEQGSSHGLLLFLRSSALLHDYLSDKSHLQTQQALYYSGLTAVGLKNNNFWSFPEDYFLACLSLTKGTSYSSRCASELRQLKGNKN
jgi:hypothetical protein